VSFRRGTSKYAKGAKMGRFWDLRVFLLVGNVPKLEEIGVYE
jgi:hypothetical protein